MIRNLIQLAELSKKVAGEAPLIADSILLVSPGISNAEAIAVRQRFPEISDDYLEVMSQFRWEPVSIGYISPWPWPDPTEKSLLRALELANDPATNPNFEDTESRNLLEVARIEGDPVCIAMQGASLGSGSVWWMHFEELPVRYSKVGENFEQFLVIAGNIWEIARRDLGVRAIPVAEEVIAQLTSDQQVREGWREAVTMLT
jgi:hypothetical protein